MHSIDYWQSLSSLYGSYNSACYVHSYTYVARQLTPAYPLLASTRSLEAALGILCAQPDTGCLHEKEQWEATVPMVLLFSSIMDPLGFQALKGHLATILWYSDFRNMYFRLLND